MIYTTLQKWVGGFVKLRLTNKTEIHGVLKYADMRWYIEIPCKNYSAATFSFKLHDVIEINSNRYINIREN